ncbi:bifunctional T-complex protein 1 [Babesia duncani]|uniref:T-complex protein 1 subunit alpha n=1 Tax=Babesia duncani TaxID=323732 RepID=A0AAD9UQ27_9APIC|nr:bifunctional T-complex protein 1 [Babesia duncani]
MTVGILGHRSTSKDVRAGNVTAVQAVANILKSSLGPKGMDKMLVDDVGDVTITNDGATMLKLLEVQHPAAKLLVDLSELQDQEVGDGTTSVVLLAAELLKRANALVNAGIHPTSIISGYKLAIKDGIKYIKENLSQRVDQLGKEVLLNIAKTTLSSKLIGYDPNYFAQMVVNAIQAVKHTDANGITKYPVDAINIIKIHGKSSGESYMVDGYAIMMSRAAQGMPLSINNAKIAFLDFALKQYRLHLGVQVKITNPDELEKVRLKEKNVAKQRVEMILASGANVIVTSQGIDDMSLKYITEAGAIALRRVTKKDLKRLARLTGGTIVLTMATPEGGEAFSPSNLGSCNQVSEQRVGDWECMFFQGCKGSKATTLLLRGANDFMTDEVERSVHDALCAVSRALELDSLVPGGGCVETAVSIYLEDFARTLGTREQLAIAEFAEALLVIPKTLALNAALDATELVAQLRACHAKSQSAQGLEKAKGYKWFGLDLDNAKIRNNLEAGVLEATISKIKSIRFATEVAITILRIDDLITLEPEKPAPDSDQE